MPSGAPRKRRKLSHTESNDLKPSTRTLGDTSLPSGSLFPMLEKGGVCSAEDVQKSHGDDSLYVLRKMVWGKCQHTFEQRQ